MAHPASESDADLIGVILGCEIPALNTEQLMEIIVITSRMVCNKHQRVIRLSKGIG